jgi:hypothetical protein
MGLPRIDVVAAEPALPQPVTQDHDLIVAGRVLFLDEISAECGLDADGAKVRP